MILIVNGKQQAVHAPTDPLTRSVIISLFTWRRAEPDDDSVHPMGWWGDTYPTVQNDRIGSRLYLLRREKVTSKTTELVRGYIEQALAWMKEDGVITRSLITVQRHGTETITAEITLYRTGGADHRITLTDLWSAPDG
ncbi:MULTISPECIES: phage GP46 family protein [unclassified Serratia (in: enterobacteria)]|uniref:phage GP46 family protein n=1 Tax=unclassified Serratia (in: enterobacteria) TaxID=2647522 RepID=UPI0005086B56|nr:MULTISPECIES: phage GP46 family protein [unclassified Serratia (in: enterobacteria)]KFK95013.1 phage GP46 family protein [Serratia sp. Ag1]KFK96696.1 phage GP46 family protein [Serratia sp. Ag2]